MLSETTRFRYSEHVDGPLEFNRFLFFADDGSLMGGGEEIFRHVSHPLKHRNGGGAKTVFPCLRAHTGNDHLKKRAPRLPAVSVGGGGGGSR